MISTAIVLRYVISSGKARTEREKLILSERMADKRLDERTTGSKLYKVIGIKTYCNTMYDADGEFIPIEISNDDDAGKFVFRSEQYLQIY